MNSPGWHTLSLGDASLATEALERIQQTFAIALAAAGHPMDMALFFGHESEGRIHCEVRLYFSPRAEPTARASRALPCEKPSPDGLSLLAGSASCWPVLFPEEIIGR